MNSYRKFFNNQASQTIADVYLFSHPHTDAPTNTTTTAVKVVLQQQIDNERKSIAFLSKRSGYSTFYLAVYLAIKHFQHFVEGH